MIGQMISKIKICVLPLEATVNPNSHLVKFSNLCRLKEKAGLLIVGYTNNVHPFHYFKIKKSFRMRFSTLDHSAGRIAAIGSGY